MKILFICTGNLCRSVMAEQWLRRLAAERGLDWETRSCGTAAERYFTVPEPVLTVLARSGTSDVSHTPQLVTRELLHWSDVALVMTRAQWELVADKYPEFARKLALLRDYTGTGKGDLEDPMGGDAAVFETCWRDVRAAVTRLVE